MARMRSVSGWYWLGTAILLAFGLAGRPWGVPLAMTLVIVQAAHYRITEGSWRAFPVQIRIAYLALLTAGCWPPLSFLHWVQLVGVTTFLATGYCLLARLLLLCSWNRRFPLTPIYAAHVLLSAAPGTGAPVPPGPCTECRLRGIGGAGTAKAAGR